MAQATRMVMGANAKLAIGPDVDNGWYYDVDFGDITLEESKLKDIEKKMKGPSFAKHKSSNNSHFQ
jgi:threonyl-tRNA synthetase